MTNLLEQAINCNDGACAARGCFDVLQAEERGIADEVPIKLGPVVKLPSVRRVGDLRRLTAWPLKHRLVKSADFLEVRVELP